MFHCIIAYDETCGHSHAPTPSNVPPAPADALEAIIPENYHGFHPHPSSVVDATLFHTPLSFSSNFAGSLNPQFPWAPCNAYNAILATTNNATPPEMPHLTAPYQLPNTFGDLSVGELNSSLENLARVLVRTIALHYINSQVQQHTDCQPF